MNNLEVTHPNNQQTEKMLGIEGYTFLGWENGWAKTPQALTDCKHQKKTKMHNQRGSNETTWCDECRYYYKTDSSD